MVSIRSTSFLLGLIFNFLWLRGSSAYSNHAKDKIMVEAAHLPVGKEPFDAVPMPAEARNLEVGGRKMMEKNVLGKKVDVLKISGKPKQKRKEKLNVKRKFSHGTSDQKVKFGGFMAFNADYHVPKPHPPKNN